MTTSKLTLRIRQSGSVGEVKVLAQVAASRQFDEGGRELAAGVALVQAGKGHYLAAVVTRAANVDQRLSWRRFGEKAQQCG
jgi:hypothetical protein